MPRLHKKGWKQQCFLHKRRFKQQISRRCVTKKKNYNILFSGVLQLRSHITDEVIKRQPSSLCCCRLHSQIEVLNTQRDAVIGEYSAAEKKNGFSRITLLSKAEPWNNRVSAASYRFLPPQSICKTKRQKERRRDSRLSSTQMPQGPRSLCSTVFNVLNLGASAYSVRRRASKKTNTKSGKWAIFAL